MPSLLGTGPGLHYKKFVKYIKIDKSVSKTQSKQMSICVCVSWGGLSRVGHDPPKILVGWATMHLTPPIFGLYVR